MEKIKVLIVDDKRVVGDFFNFILGFRGHEVKLARSSEEAFELVKNEKFDIAFLDIIVSNEDGIDILEEIKMIAPRLPVVVMSGFALEEKMEEAEKLGAVKCLRKPMDMQDVRKVIKEVTGKEV